MIGHPVYFYFTILLLLLSVSGCKLQEARRILQEISPPPLYRISGTVTDRNSGFPIEGAEVSVIVPGKQNKKCITGPQGLYQFYNLPPGICSLNYGKSNSAYKDGQLTLNLEKDEIRHLQLSLPFISYCYGGSRDDIAVSLAVMKDGKWLIAGYTNSADSDLADKRELWAQDFDIWLLKIEPETGKILFNRCYGGSGDDKAVKVLEKENGELFLLGVTESTDGDLKNRRKKQTKQNRRDIWLLKLNPENGDILLSTCYGGSGDDSGVDMLETDQGDLLIAGSTNSYDGDLSHRKKRLREKTNYDFWLFRINPLQSGVLFSTTYGYEENELACRITKTRCGHIAALATVSPPQRKFKKKRKTKNPPAPSGMLFLKIEQNTGGIILSRVYRSTAAQKAAAIVPCGEENLLIAGSVLLETDEKKNWHPWYFEIEPLKGDITVNSVDKTDDNFLQEIVPADPYFFIGTGVKEINGGDLSIVEMRFPKETDLFGRYYGGRGRDRGISIVKTRKGWLAVLGTTQSQDGDLAGIRKGTGTDTDIWLLRINGNPETAPEILENPATEISPP